jgi:hypothetical protein
MFKAFGSALAVVLCITGCPAMQALAAQHSHQDRTRSEIDSSKKAIAPPQEETWTDWFGNVWQVTKETAHESAEFVRDVGTDVATFATGCHLAPRCKQFFFRVIRRGHAH